MLSSWGGAPRAALAVGALLLLAGSLASAVSVVEAGGLPAATARVPVGPLTLVRGPGVEGQSEGVWTTVALDAIETSARKDLLLHLSLECGLYTPAPAERERAADVQLRVLVDGRPAEPAQVAFARRSEALSPALQRLFERALTLDPGTGAVQIDEARLAPAEVALLRGAMAPCAFAFVLPDVRSGVHVVELQARIALSAAAQAGQAVAKATLGRGSLTIEGASRIRGESATF